MLFLGKEQFLRQWNGSGLNPLNHYCPPSSDTDQPKELLSRPPCLLLMPLHCKVSSPEPGLSSTWSRRAHGIACVPPRFAVPPFPMQCFARALQLCHP